MTRYFIVNRNDIAELAPLKGLGLGAVPKFEFDENGDATGRLIIELPDQAVGRFSNAVGRPPEPPGFTVRVDSDKRNNRNNPPGPPDLPDQPGAPGQLNNRDS